MDPLELLINHQKHLKKFEAFYEKLPKTDMLVRLKIEHSYVEVAYKKTKNSPTLFWFHYGNNGTHVLDNRYATENELLEKVTDLLNCSDYGKVVIIVDGTYKVEGQYAKVTKHDDNSFTVQYFCPPEDPFSQPFTES